MPNSKILRSQAMNNAGLTHRGRTVQPHDTRRQPTTGQMMALLEGYTQWGPAYGHMHSDVHPGDGARDGRESLRREASGYAAALSAGGAASEPDVAPPCMVVRFWRWLQHERRIARGIVELGELDDRTLRDLGIHRSEISHIVRYGAEGRS